MSEGHYTIYAVDAAGNRVADELSGTVSNGKFIPDVNKQIYLDPGTYTFVCHNDAFTKTATGLSIGSGISTYPMMGTVTKTLSGGYETVSFNMKHLAARIRAQVTTYTAYAKMKSNGTYLMALGNKFSDMEFDNRGIFQQRVSSGPTLYTHDGIESFSNDGAKPYSYYVEPFDVISSYSYIPLAENENIPANGLVYTLNGSYHGKEKQKSITIDTPLERNHTYLVKLTMKTKDPLYLYQDGTVGYAGDKEVGTREPIALVINEKTATEKGMAVALKDAGQRGTPGFGYYNVGIGGDDGTINNMQGYDITYTTNYCYYPGPTPTVPPADIKSEPWETDGYAYYLAAHYNPGIQVTGSNVGKWFLASSGQWTPLLVKYGELDKSKMPSDFNIPTYTYEVHPCFAENSTTPLNTAKLASAFTQAGGTFSMDDQYPVSGTVNGGYAGYIGFTPTKVGWGYDIFVRNGTGAGLVHPFVYF